MENFLRNERDRKSKSNNSEFLNYRKHLTTCEQWRKKINWSLLLEIRNNKDVSKKVSKNGHRQCGVSYPWHIFPV